MYSSVTILFGINITYLNFLHFFCHFCRIAKELTRHTTKIHAFLTHFHLYTLSQAYTRTHIHIHIGNQQSDTSHSHSDSRSNSYAMISAIVFTFIYLCKSPRIAENSDCFLKFETFIFNVSFHETCGVYVPEDISEVGTAGNPLLRGW